MFFKVRNMKKEKAIMFAVTRELYFALGVLLVNITSIEPDTYDFLVYEDGLTDEQKDFLKKLVRNRIVFVHYSYADWCREHGMDPEAQSLPQTKALVRYSHLNFSKHKIFQALAEYRRILYLDVDMLVLGSLEDLFSRKGVVAARGGLFLESFKRMMGEKLYSTVDLSCVTDKMFMINGGLFYADDSCDYEALYATAVAFISQCLMYEPPKTGLDEFAFMYTCYANSVTPELLIRDTYNTRFFQCGQRPLIVHFQGGAECKPWSKSDKWQLVYPEWYSYYQRWTLAGGEPYGPGIQLSLKKNLIISYLANSAFVKVLSIINFHDYPGLRYCGPDNSAPDIFNFLLAGNAVYIKVQVDKYPKFNYVLGLKTHAKCDLLDTVFTDRINDLADRNSLFAVKFARDSIHLYTAAVPEDELGSTFRYFHNAVTALR